MRDILATIATIIMICIAEVASSQTYFRKFDASTSLPDNNVRNMIMLPSGVMCIETTSMLNMFDGMSVASRRYDLDKVPYTEYNGVKELYNDSRDRLWIKNRDNIWVYDPKQESFIYDINSLIAEFGIDCNVDNIFIIDRDKYLIYNEDQHSIHYYNDTSKVSREIALPEMLGEPGSIVRIDDYLWILCNNGRLAQWSEKSSSFLYIERNIEELSRFRMIADNRRQIWITTDNELICYDTNEYQRREEIDIKLDNTDIFTTIAFDREDHIWVGSSKSGVRMVDNTTFEVEHLPYLELIDGNKIEHNTDISHIYVDDNKGVWIATETDGLLYHHRDIFRFESINNTTFARGELSDQNIKCMLNEPDGGILLGTVNGLFKYDPISNSVTLPYPELASELCVGLYRDNGGRVWLGTFHNGAFCIDNGSIRHYVYDDMPDINISYLNSTPNFNNIRTFYQSSEGDMFVGIYGGIGVLDEESGEIDLIEEVAGRCFITRSITPIDEDRLIINGDNGVFIYNKQTRAIERDNFKFPQRRNSCYDLLIDSRGLIWIATLDGLVIYNPADESHRVLRRDSGLSNNKVLSILEDNFNNIWITTSAGVSVVKMRDRWSLDDVMVVNFTQSDGIPNSSFFQLSSIQGGDGKLYFGSSNGMCAIEPASIINSSKREKPVLLNLRLYNRSIGVGDTFFEDKILDRPLSDVSQLKLKHNESFITFEFSGLNYSNPNHTQYRYMLENFNDDWVEIRDIKSVASATFSLLHPGRYVFKVQSAINGGWWSDETTKIRLTILPPWWRSNVAIVAYFVLILATIYAIIISIVDKSNRESLKRQEVEEERRRAEVEELKLRFFVNVSHELRTPLSLIIIPLESLIEKINDQQIRPQLETMHRNAKSLLQLVNHLLDFRKIDMNHEKLNPSGGDMNSFIESIYDSFRGSAEINMINLTFESHLSRLPMAFDHGMMHKILNNLLSNAMKFTPEGGSVSISLEVNEGEEYAEIRVSDTGYGIPQKDLDFIFDRFFQASNNSDAKGTGIGLNLTKSYVELHGGEISVESVLGSGSTFRVVIPMNIEATSQEDTATSEPPLHIEKSEEESDKERYKLLIIEDNKDFRDYMVSELKEFYDISTAENGKQGLMAVGESMPDLITSDVMMAEMDGLELCRRLKSNIDTSHIPIILLTAHASDESRLSSYESGADAYISKPFHWGVLHARIRNLIEERKKRIQSFNTNGEDDLGALVLAPLDKKFITRAIESIERNLDNTDYSVETMSEDLSMNRMSIYRKFKSIMEQTPAEFIRTVRLKRAARWIESGKGRGYSLVEISQMFGFNTPKYFSKYFKEIYGETPMQYITRFKKM